MNESLSRRGSSLVLLLAVLALLNAGVLLLHIMMGDFPVPAWDALKTAVGQGDARYELVVNRFRLPRALVACMAGGALALSGVILQGITRNPLAAPGVIGLNAGAALAVVTALVLLPSLPVSALPLIAFAGALLAAAVSYTLAWRRGLSPVRLVLVGVSVSAVAGAGVTFLLTIGGIGEARRAIIWMTGSVYGRSWEHLWSLLPWLALLLPLALLLARQLDVLQLGDELARGVGSRVEKARLLLLLISVALAGSAVATAGTIGFVGLMAPHMARYIVGPASHRLMPTAVLLGGLLVMLADLIGRTALKPIEIPCGIIIALVGAPYMLYLLYTKRNM